MVHTKVVFEEGWSFIRGRKQCKPKHVSSGIVVLNVRWSLIRVVSQEGDYCTLDIFHVSIVININKLLEVNCDHQLPKTEDIKLGFNFTFHTLSFNYSDAL